MPDHVLQAFHFCPRCGARPSVVGASPFRCSDCDFSFYFGPAAAVGALVRNDQGELLFLIRGRDPGKGKYGLPGGFVDVNETLEQALVREVREETSLSVTQAQYLCSFPNTYQYRGAKVDVLDAFFVCRVDSMEQLVAQAGEVDGFRIARPTPEMLENMAFQSNRLAIQCLLKKSTNGSVTS